jgi:membrane protein DedA with SNARE-associated domain
VSQLRGRSHQVRSGDRTLIWLCWQESKTCTKFLAAPGAMHDFFTTLTLSLASLDAIAVYAIGFAVIVVCGLGLPLPEDITLLTMGYLTYLPMPDGSPRPHASVMLGTIAGFIGCMGGDGVMFGIGRRYGMSIIGRRPFSWLLTPGRLDRARRIMDQHGPKILFAARFMPGIRSVGYFTAGSLGTPYLRFLTYDGLAAMISVPFFVFSGWHWGSNIEWAIAQVHHAEHGMLALIGLVTVVTVLKAMRARRREASFARQGASATHSVR